MLYIFLKYLLTPVYWLLFRPTCYRRENLRVKGKAIFVCNHVSMLDAATLAILSPRIVHFMAKAELFKNPVGNLFFRSLMAFPVTRTQADLSSMKRAMRVLQNGKVFGIFPEGKRTITNDMDSLEKGAAFLASRSGAPIIPMYIRRDSYTGLRLVMIVGEPILVGDLVANTPKTKIVDVLTDEISDALRALQAEIETDANPAR
ncbi:1-acyl-sn-glycerol-3-phosphate acyltransferase [Christensenellaceae bacterium OttesenSCG-928-L17]|nr:1-acyl-sn-glycerol-3-phosphate acyltransferase [Christensenellaceae bacterium OttesenSCG-928-L17]